MTTNEELIDLCNNPSSSARSQFLRSLDLEGAGKYISGVDYIARESRLIGFKGLKIVVNNSYRMSISNPAARIFLIPRFKSRVKVYPISFERIREESWHLGDFLSMLIDHEGYHAKELFESPKIISHFSDVNNAEYRAYENQVRNFDKRNCSPTFRIWAEEMRNCYKRVSCELNSN